MRPGPTAAGVEGLAPLEGRPVEHDKEARAGRVAAPRSCAATAAQTFARRDYMPCMWSTIAAKVGKVIVVPSGIVQTTAGGAAR